MKKSARIDSEYQIIYDNSMQFEHSVSCIIPVYNEEKYVSNVLNVVTKYNGFCEIIVVNDGSTDNSISQITQFENIKLFDFKENRGKTAVIKDAINAAKGDVILMIDSDLIGLTHEHMDRLLEPVINHTYDMTISDRYGDRKRPAYGWTGFSRLVSGERAFFRSDFLDIDFSGYEGYLLETGLNFCFIDKGKKVLNIYFDDLDCPTKIEKTTFSDGLKGYLGVAGSVLQKAGIGGMLKQNYCIDSTLLNQHFPWLKEKKGQWYIRAIYPILTFSSSIRQFRVIRKRAA